MMDDLKNRPVLVFEIDDGATHWVAARSELEALQINALAICDSFSTYIDEVCDGCVPKVTIYLKDELVVREDMPVSPDYPLGAYTAVHIPRDKFKYLNPRQISTTEY